MKEMIRVFNFMFFKMTKLCLKKAQLDEIYRHSLELFASHFSILRTHLLVKRNQNRLESKNFQDRWCALSASAASMGSMAEEDRA